MNKADLVIVGGGITGLCAAYFACKERKSILILEKSPQPGGLLNTFQIGNTSLEYFYHHFFIHDKELLWLLKELNIDKTIILKKTKMGFYLHSKLIQFNTIIDLIKFPHLNLFNKLMFSASSVFLSKFAKWEKYENISAIDWFNKWLGPKVTNLIWTPMLSIKFGSFATHVPLSWMIGRLRQRVNSRKKGKEQLGYLRGSMQILVDTIIMELEKRNVVIKKDEEVIQILQNTHSACQLKTKNNTYQGKQVLFTMPSPVIAALIQPIDVELSQKLLQIKYFSVACVVLVLKEALSDTYWLNIADGNFLFGGVIEHTNFISQNAYNGNHIVYLSRYFNSDDEIALMSDDEILQKMTSQLFQIFKHKNPDIILSKNIFKSRFAAPVCGLNYSTQIIPCKLPIRNMYIANMMHLYPDERSINNSIRLAAEACKVMGIDTSYMPTGNSMAAKINFVC